MIITRPMLAAKFDLLNDREMLMAIGPNRFPLYASFKVDGVRAFIQDGMLLSRSFKPIPNLFLQKRFSKKEYEGLDGELVIGNPASSECYKDTVSAVMRKDGEPDVNLWVFDKIEEGTFQERQRDYHLLANKLPHTRALQQHYVTSKRQLLDFEKAALEVGYEGLMLRSIHGPYKQGRSTLREGYLVKLKRFVDSEAEVLEVVELQRNNNAAKTNELGLTKRSAAKAGKVGGETMGVLVCRDIHTKQIVELGTGFTEEERKAWWSVRHCCKGTLVVYKHFPIGAYEAPRHPVYKGIRHGKDL